MIFWMSLFSLLSGAFLVAAFAPFNIDYAAFLLPAFFLYMLVRLPPKKAFSMGFLFGVGFFGVGISWIYVSVHQYGNASALLAALITFLLAAFLALFPATLCFVFRKFFSTMSTTWQYLLIFPALWTIWELLRGTLLTGFPWLLIGYTQLNTPLSGLAPLVGVYGLSFITVMVSGALLLISEKKSFLTHMVALSLMVLFFGVGFGLRNHAWTMPIGKPFNVGLIQGNIAQNVKWDARYVSRNINFYMQLTLENLDHRLMIWPEGAIPIYADEATLFTKKLGEMAKSYKSTIIFGVPIRKDNRIYNGLLMVGDNQGEYLKEHLVPFGEYTPFQAVMQKIMAHFQIPMSDFNAGPDTQAPLNVEHLRIAPFICYEIIFPGRVWQESVYSNVLLNLSDDSWFGSSIAMYQQYQMARMRALETGRPLLVATNTGITAFVSPLGKTLRSATVQKEAVLTGTVQPMTGETPIMKIYNFL